MGDKYRANMTKLLVAFALLALANAAVCRKITLGSCYSPSTGAYGKVTLSSSTYTAQTFSASDCTGTATMSETTTADACKEVDATAPGKSLKVLSGATYSSTSTSSADCTSGTCVTNSASHATIGIIGIMAIFVGLVTNSM